ncbi:uncharacterized protein LOC105228576 isoform X1 [Bactrocera dorsalis]|uniref:Uncharacterized protein LOC105228576 isoform X1 n=1 Tax=Bactrocera dorsalis TaxID=27457 RepID=A0ABM3JRE3_BACDO|nr:uncharacterized protein LOC105228576 isoform X1 [Bactrocera dorsalis]
MEKRDKSWDIDTTLKLIKKVEQQRLLWDTHDIDFLNIVKKRRVFSEIGTEFGCIGSEIERKWRELRNQYRREKLQYSNLNAMPSWFAYEHMRFVDNHDSCNSLTIAPTSPVSTNSSIAEASNAFFRAYKLQNGKYPLSSDAISDVEQTQIADRDEFEIFAEGVAAKLRKIQDPRVQLCVQRDIDNALYDALMKNAVPKRNSISALTSSSSNNRYKSLKYIVPVVERHFTGMQP